MLRTKEALGNVVNYELISGIRPLEPLKIEKKDIPNFILCQNYDKALQKVERTMESYNRKVGDLKEKLQQLEFDIKDMRKEHEKWSRKASTFLLDRSDLKAVEKQNQAADNANRLLDKISAATDKYDDLVERHNEAINEAKEKLEELTQEALQVIDEDIVGVLDKCTRIATKLSESANSDDRIFAVETCFIEFKIYNSFEGHIEGNVPRKDAKERICEVNKLYGELCTNKDVRNYLAELFHKNSYLIQKNAELYNQINQVIENVSQEELSSMTQSMQHVLKENFKTNFEYHGIIDPSELDKVVININKTINSININIDKTNELFTSTQVIAEAGLNAHQNAETLLANMKNNTETMRDDLLSRGHFASDIISRVVIDDFYQKDVRPAIIDLRAHIVKHVGEEQLDALLVENDDRYSIGKAESTIKQADLLRLQAQRDQVAEHVRKLNNIIKNLKTDIQKAGQVPQENADSCWSVTSKLYILSCLPLLGFAFALGILGKIKKFSPAFNSTNEIYRKLCKETFEKNKVMQKVNLVLGIVLGICGLVAFLGFGISTNIGVNIGVPVAILVLYLVTWAILVKIGKDLQSHLEVKKVAQ